MPYCAYCVTADRMGVLADDSTTQLSPMNAPYYPACNTVARSIPLFRNLL